MTLEQQRIGFIGAGNMAQALIGGLIGRGVAAERIRAIEPYAQTRDAVQAKYGIVVDEVASDALGACSVIVLAVKPQVMRAVCAEIAPHLQRGARAPLIVSVAAGIRARDLGRWLDTDRVVRVMPNTPALVGAGITGMAALPGATADDRTLAEAMLLAVGEVVWVDDEAKLDGVTALSGSGPAYVFLFIEAMQEAAARLGFTPEQGRQLAVATFAGAAKLAAQSSEPASVLRERVTSKGGTTYAALTTMGERGVKEAIVDGVLAAAARSVELGDEFGR